MQPASGRRRNSLTAISIVRSAPSLWETRRAQAQATHYYRMAAPDLARARRLYESILPWDGAGESLKQVNDAIRRISRISDKGKGINGGNSQHVVRTRDPELSPNHTGGRERG